MFAEGALTAARASQRSLMTETIIVTVTSAPVWDEDAQESVATTTEVYEGIARAATSAASSPTIAADGRVVTPSQVAITVPWDAPTLPTSAEIHITASTVSNPLVGAHVWVDDETTGPLPTARRYLCRDAR